MFVAMDSRGRIRELCYPHVGLWNHLNGHIVRFGVWVDGEFSWLDDDAWDVGQSFDDGSNRGLIRFHNTERGIVVEAACVLDGSRNCFRVDFTIASPGVACETRFFATHDLRIAESDIGDTAYFDPFLGGIAHYKGPNWFLFDLAGDLSDMQYACGIKGFGGLEGTWVDAEDGELSGNAIAQGSVDSTLGATVRNVGDGPAKLQYRILCGESRSALLDLRAESSIGGASPLIADGIFSGLPEDVAVAARQSALILLSHVDASGAVIAAIDSDIMETNRANYAYCWPRDGAFVVDALLRLGLPEPARRFFEFCADLVSQDQPFLLQKYRPDGTLGSTWHPWIVDGHPEIPIQQDETALVLWSMGRATRCSAFGELDQSIWERFVAPCADHLLNSLDPSTGLPAQSYDLWEERRGVHAFTVAAISAGLREAGYIAEHRDPVRANRYVHASLELANLLRARFWAPEGGRLVRSIRGDSLAEHNDMTPDSSLLLVPIVGALPFDDERVSSTVDAVERALLVESTGGLARYEGDYYFRVSERFPGNPWLITTLWLARVRIAAARSRAGLEAPLELLHWAARIGGSTGALPEQICTETGRHLSVSPLAWSHAEFLAAALDWQEAAIRLGGL
jgi:GH15 family glucan-1,4-alpha-glucosidase